MAWTQYAGFGVGLTMYALFMIFSPVRIRQFIVASTFVLACAVPFLKGLAWVVAVPIFARLGLLVWEHFAPRVKQHTVDAIEMRLLVYDLIRPLLGILAIGWWLPKLAPYLPHVPWSLKDHHVNIVVQSILFMVAMDFHETIWHMADHKFDFLWSLHKVHHSSTKLTIFAWAPVHFFAMMVLKTPTAILIAGLCDFDPAAYPLYAVAYGILTTLWVHANIDFPKAGKRPFWAMLIANPTLHGRHHTVEGMRSNYAMLLPIWDIIFGNYHFPEKAPTEFGIGEEKFSSQGIIADQIAPFIPASWLERIQAKWPLVFPSRKADGREEKSDRQSAA